MIQNSIKVLDVCLDLIRSEGKLEELLGLVDGTTPYVSTGEQWFIMHRSCITNSEVFFPDLTDYWVAVVTEELSGKYFACHEDIVGVVIQYLEGDLKAEFLRLAKSRLGQQYN